jgi:hypothetical protein
MNVREIGRGARAVHRVSRARVLLSARLDASGQAAPERARGGGGALRATIIKRAAMALARSESIVIDEVLSLLKRVESDSTREVSAAPQPRGAAQPRGR